MFIKYDDHSECSVLCDVGRNEFGDYEVVTLVDDEHWEKLTEGEVALMRLFYDFEIALMRLFYAV